MCNKKNEASYKDNTYRFSIKNAFLTLFLLFISFDLSYAVIHINPKQVKKWFILLDYDSSKGEITPADFKGYDMAILDPDAHPDLEELKNKLLLISYISLGEVGDYRSYWPLIKDKPWIVGVNPDWNGAHYVDIRHQEWHQLILDEIIPAIIKQGFNGLMLDTLDTADYLQSLDAVRYHGANESMVALVKEIHQRYPDLCLISNNGFSILSEISPFLSGLLVEDIHMMVDFKNNTYKPVPLDERKVKLGILDEIIKSNQLPVFNIDYVDQKNLRLIRKCIKNSKKLTFNPYVAQKNLDKIYPN